MANNKTARCVRLKQAIPELQLRAGAVGTVCSMWLQPHTAYEVEFCEPGLGGAVRVLLLEQQLEESIVVAAT